METLAAASTVGIPPAVIVAVEITEMTMVGPTMRVIRTKQRP